MRREPPVSVDRNDLFHLALFFSIAILANRERSTVDLANTLKVATFFCIFPYFFLRLASPLTRIWPSGLLFGWDCGPTSDIHEHV